MGGSPHLSADVALERFDVVMGHQVHLQGLRLSESLRADWTLEGFQAGMDEQMALQVGFDGECLMADGAGVRSQAEMRRLLVHLQKHSQTSDSSSFVNGKVHEDHEGPP